MEPKLAENKFKIETQRVFPFVDVVNLVRTLVLALAQAEAILLGPHRRGNQHHHHYPQQRKRQVVMRSKCQEDDSAAGANAATPINNQQNSEDEMDEKHKQK